MSVNNDVTDAFAAYAIILYEHFDYVIKNRQVVIFSVLFVLASLNDLAHAKLSVNYLGT